jgi:hypothetical protein
MCIYAPFTGFGDDPNTSVKFTIMLPGETMPDWSGGPRLRQKKIPGSSRVNIRNTGRDPYIVTFLLDVDSLEEYEALDRMQGVEATLRYAWGITKPVGGHYESIQNVGYLAIPNVRLMQLSDPVVDVETYSTSATFLKPYGGAL